MILFPWAKADAKQTRRIELLLSGYDHLFPRSRRRENFAAFLSGPMAPAVSTCGGLPGAAQECPSVRGDQFQD